MQMPILLFLLTSNIVFIYFINLQVNLIRHFSYGLGKILHKGYSGLHPEAAPMPGNH